MLRKIWRAISRTGQKTAESLPEPEQVTQVIKSEVKEPGEVRAVLSPFEVAEMLEWYADTYNYGYRDARADRYIELLGKNIRITGIIRVIDFQRGTLRIKLEDACCVKVNLDCFSEEADEQLKLLKEGDKITVEGTFEEGGNITDVSVIRLVK